MKSKWRVTRQGIQAMPITDPHQWGPDAYDFDSLELARFARLFLKDNKPRVPYRPIKVDQKPVAASA